MRRIIVTGAAGFIGRHLVGRLLLKYSDCRIIGIDNFSTGSLRETEALMGDERFVIQNPTLGSMRGALLDAHEDMGGVDEIYHLAARLGVRYIAQDPLSMLREHGEHALVVCPLAATWKAKLMLTSTSEVYGMAKPPFAEDGPHVLGSSNISRWGYAVSKLYMEHVGLAYAQRDGIKVVIPRLFNVVGPGQRWDTGMVLPRFAHAAVRGQALTVHGTGAHVRSFSHVQDVADRLILLMGEPSVQGVINVGSSNKVRIVRLAEKVIRYVGKTYGAWGEIEYLPIEGLDPQMAVADMRVRRGKLDPVYGDVHSDLDRCIKDVCDYHHARLEGER